MKASQASIQGFKRFAHSAPKKEWLVTIYDKPNVDRLKFRSEHIGELPNVFGKIVTSGGGLLNKEGKFIGSSFHIRADNEEEVIDFLQKDIYAQKGIWDFNSITIHQILIAAREEKLPQ